MNILSPSILAADFAKLGEQIKKTEEGGAQYVHIDVMDGMFVPAISLGMCVIRSIRPITDMVFDVHLMITEPIRYIEEFAKCGADIITVHEEACVDVKATLEAIHSCGKKAGLSIKPGTSVSVLEPYMDQLDMILMMSVEPGFGGQKYIEEATERIHTVKKRIEASGYAIDLEVDGGIHTGNVSEVLQAGANVIVAGSAVYKDDIAKNTQEFMKILAEHE